MLPDNGVDEGGFISALVADFGTVAAVVFGGYLTFLIIRRMFALSDLSLGPGSGSRIGPYLTQEERGFAAIAWAAKEQDDAMWEERAEELYQEGFFQNPYIEERCWICNGGIDSGGYCEKCGRHRDYA